MNYSETIVEKYRQIGTIFVCFYEIRLYSAAEMSYVNSYICPESNTGYFPILQARGVDGGSTPPAIE